MLLKNLSAVWVNLNLPLARHAGALEAKVKASDTSE
jgi:hypothetical protein